MNVERPEIVRYFTATYVYEVANGYCRSISDGANIILKHPAIGYRLLGGVPAQQPASPATPKVSKGQRAKFESVDGAGWISDPVMLVEDEGASRISHIDLSDEELAQLEDALPSSIRKAPPPPPPRTARSVVQKSL